MEKHLGDNWVRASRHVLDNEGLKRGMPVNDTGGPITVPVGEGTLGRVFNVTGDPVDDRGPVTYTKRYPIHRKAPGGTHGPRIPARAILETGIKVMRISFAPSSRAAKSARSAAPASARPSSSWN